MRTSTIDYAIANTKAVEKIRLVKEREREDSDYLPIEVELKGPAIEKGTLEIEKTGMVRNIWTEEGVIHYHKECEGWTTSKEQTNELWEDIRNKVKNSTLKKKMRRRNWKFGWREWYSKE